MSAGDTAASAYLHPLADAAQVNHILRGPARTVLALERIGPEALSHEDAMGRYLNDHEGRGDG